MKNSVNEILAELSLEDKIAMLTGKDYWHTRDVDGVIESVMVCDGPHGLRKQDGEQDNLGVNKAVLATCFPNAVNTASSFDKELLYELGAVLGKECRAQDVAVLLGPGINIKRSPLCGRNFEYFSEDPYLSGVLASQIIKGVQSQGVGTSIKHFAVNNQETRRNIISAVVDERAYREIYLAGFEYAVKNAEPWTVMCAYNKINGVYCSENEELLENILRKEWGYKGLVVSDWGAVLDRPKALKGGIDLDMPYNYGYSAKLMKKAVENGEISERDIDRSVSRIIELILKYRETLNNSDEPVIYDRDKDHEFALKAARESMVLLKNDSLLPLDKTKKIAFIGELAVKPRYQGGGSSHINTDKAISPIEAVKDYANVEYSRGYDLSMEKAADDCLIVEAIEAAGRSDVAVVFVGLPERAESEGYDREYMDLPYNQTALIKELVKVQDNIVIVLFNGAPVTMPWIKDIGAVLEAYLPGEACGEAIRDIIFGDYSPCGKTAETFPLGVYDAPCHDYFPGNRLTVEYRESIYVGYRYYEKAHKDVLFPFGHGLTYTTFVYSDIELDKSVIEADEGTVVTFKLTNTGDMTAKEIVQVYAGAPQTDVFMPIKQLCGFDKIELKPGESETVRISIDNRAFRYYNVIEKRFVTLGGEYVIHVGASSADIRLSAKLNVKGEIVKSPYSDKILPDYFNLNVKNISDEEYTSLYGRSLPPAEYGGKRVFTLYDCLEDVRNTGWGKLIIKLAMKNAVETDDLGDSDIYSKSMLTAPFAIMPGMTNGLVDDNVLKIMLDLFNGRKKFRSVIGLAKAGLKILKKLKNNETI